MQVWCATMVKRIQDGGCCCELKDPTRLANEGLSFDRLTNRVYGLWFRVYGVGFMV